MHPSPSDDKQRMRLLRGFGAGPDLRRESAAAHEAGHAVHSYAIQGRSLLEIAIRPDPDGGWSGRARYLDPPVDDFQAAVGLLIGRYAELQHVAGFASTPDFRALLALDRMATAAAVERPRYAERLLRHDDVRAIRAILRMAEREPWSSNRYPEFDVYCAVCSSVRVVYRGLERAIHAVAAELMRSRLLGGPDAMKIIDWRLGFSDSRIV